MQTEEESSLERASRLFSEHKIDCSKEEYVVSKKDLSDLTDIFKSRLFTTLLKIWEEDKTCIQSLHLYKAVSALKDLLGRNFYVNLNIPKSVYYYVSSDLVDRLVDDDVIPEVIFAGENELFLLSRCLLFSLPSKEDISQCFSVSLCRSNFEISNWLGHRYHIFGSRYFSDCVKVNSVKHLDIIVFTKVYTYKVDSQDILLQEVIRRSDLEKFKHLLTLYLSNTEDEEENDELIADLVFICFELNSRVILEHLLKINFCSKERLSKYCFNSTDISLIRKYCLPSPQRKVVKVATLEIYEWTLLSGKNYVPEISLVSALDNNDIGGLERYFEDEKERKIPLEAKHVIRTSLVHGNVDSFRFVTDRYSARRIALSFTGIRNIDFGDIDVEKIGVLIARKVINTSNASVYISIFIRNNVSLDVVKWYYEYFFDNSVRKAIFAAAVIMRNIQIFTWIHSVGYLETNQNTIVTLFNEVTAENNINEEFIVYLLFKYSYLRERTKIIEESFKHFVSHFNYITDYYFEKGMSCENILTISCRQNDSSYFRYLVLRFSEVSVEFLFSLKPILLEYERKDCISFLENKYNRDIDMLNTIH